LNGWHDSSNFITSALNLFTMPEKKIAIIAGATGLIGSYLVELLLNSERYERVIVLTRRSLNMQHEKLQEIQTDLQDLPQHASLLQAQDVFCCLGTTMAKAGSKQKFYAVDFTYPQILAGLCKQNGAKQFLIVTAMGANKNSRIYYNQVKGEIEEAIKTIGFEGTHIFRPSLLLGPRTEKRAGEDAAKSLYAYLGWLLPMNYKGIAAEKVAKAMLHFASVEQTGCFIHASGELQKF
jgi:uncharacterized protein YbjT (DUF2867 family)